MVYFSHVIHGDPVFSNVLLTSEGKVVFLDMRGSLSGVCTIAGDLTYDLAKVYQSLSGYDFIIHNKEPKQWIFNMLKSS